MKTSVGYVTLSCAEHKHDCYEIIFYRRGTGRFFFDESIDISSGKFIIVPPNTVHASKYDKDAETIFIKGNFNHIFSFSAPVAVMDNAEKSGEFLVNMIFENSFSKPSFISYSVNSPDCSFA